MPALVLAFYALLLALALPATPVEAQTNVRVPASGPIGLPQPTGFVNDFAGVVPPDQRARIEAVAEQVRARAGGEIAVVTIADIGARDAGDVALQIGREWKVGRNARVGDSTRNTGLVVLLVPKETSSDGQGKLFIATGQGTEGFITDAETGVIRRESLPQRQARAYGDALELTTVRLAQLYAREFGFTLDAPGAAGTQPAAPQYEYRRRGRAPPGGINPVVALVVIVVLFMIVSSVAGRGRRGCGGCVPLILPFPGGGFGGGWRGGGFGGGGGWGGGGGGGGGFGGFGGGGGFSGGGSGDSW
jgi:uncharacterized protein